MELANYILNIFRHYLPIVFSWGFHNPRVITNGLSFQVQGYLHTGRVEVILDEGTDTFIVRLINRNGSVKKVVEDVFVDGLVEVIDRLVERCPNYKQRVQSQYGV
ncbi:MAG: hypothetical protein J5382_09635 [Bacteroidales bacterium]|nr:hypothetical protein [Bacteroidales bacterium]